MLVGQGVIHSSDHLNLRQDLLTHFVHSVLHTWAALCGKRLESNLSSGFPCLIKFRDGLPDFAKFAESLPLPTTINVRAEDAVTSRL